MKRAYEIRIERGQNVYGKEFTVIAASDEEAIRKAKAEIQKHYACRTGWRCVSLKERETIPLT